MMRFWYVVASFTCIWTDYLAHSPVYSLLLMDLSHSPPGVLFDYVEWQWAYKLHKYSTSSLYDLICNSPYYFKYMYDACCSFLIFYKFTGDGEETKPEQLQVFWALPDVLYVVSLKCPKKPAILYSVKIQKAAIIRTNSINLAIM